MKLSSTAFLGLAASAVADTGAAVTGIIKPDSPAPGGCSVSKDGKFQVSVYSLGNSKRDLQVRIIYTQKTTQCSCHPDMCCLETRLRW